jgi:hypothetical protein
VVLAYIQVECLISVVSFCGLVRCLPKMEMKVKAKDLKVNKGLRQIEDGRAWFCILCEYDGGIVRSCPLLSW